MSRKNIPRRIKTETGFYAFNKTQAYLRFSLCIEALRQKARFNIKFKHIYQEGTIPEQYAVDRFVSNDVFDAIYQEISLLGWGSRFYNYNKQVTVEGSFYPFIRYNAGRGKKIADQGCIWIGGRSVYPRIHVDNGYCRWFKPINKAGEIRFDPFLPMREIQPRLMKLNNQLIIQSLQRD